LGYYFLKHQQEASSLLEYRFPLGQFRRHDPKCLVSKNCDLISLAWPYTDEQWEDEPPHENAKGWDEV